MRQELYIDGRLADIEGVSIPLNFACSEIADLSGVSGNYSLTIKLPLTGPNIMIAYFANLPSTTPASLWPGYRTTASYFVDGIPVFQNANTKLASSEKSIDLVVSFGNLTWLDVLGNVKLKDVITELSLPTIHNWNYWAIENEDELTKWLFIDWGGTFMDGLRMERMHPCVNVWNIWDAIWEHLNQLGLIWIIPQFTPETDLWLPIMSQNHNPALRVGADFEASTDFVLLAASDADGSFTIDRGFAYFDGTTPNTGIIFSVPGPDKRLIIPKEGNYAITGALMFDMFAFVGNITVTLYLVLIGSYPEEMVILKNISMDNFPTYPGDPDPRTIDLNETLNLKKGAYSMRIVTTSTIPSIDREDFRMYLGSDLIIDYISTANKKESLEFFMPYDIAYNMPDISCKDFVKAIMQLYGLFVENKNAVENIDNYPVFFSIDSMTGTTFEDWSEKLVSFNTPRIEWNLGMKQNEYLRYLVDEADEIYEDAYFTTYENDNSNQDLFRSIFAASNDIEETRQTLHPVPVVSIPQWVYDLEKRVWKYEGKCKQRIVRAYQNVTPGFSRTVVQLYGEDYADIVVDETMCLISWFKIVPPDVTDTGQSLDMQSIIDKYYTGFIDAVKSNRLFTFEMFLTAVDINRFAHIKPVWINRWSAFYFVKKINNWLAGRTCEVELLQLNDAGAVASLTPILTPINYGLLYNFYAITDEGGFTSEGEFVVPSKSNCETLLNYIDTYDEGYEGWPLAGGLLKGSENWEEPNEGATNIYNFNAIGSGTRDIYDGSFLGLTLIQDIGTTDTEIIGENMFQYAMFIESISTGVIIQALNDNVTSIRLVRPATESELEQEDGTPCANYIGNDGKVYPTVKIGTQVWLADNLAETKFRNGDTIPFNECDDLHSFSNIEWANLETAGCCPYDNDWSNVPMAQPTGEACPALELTFDDISNVPVADASSVSDWNTHFDLPTYGNPFTSVEVFDDMVRLIGGGEITIKKNAFPNTSHLVEISDSSGCITVVDDLAFFSSPNLTKIILPYCVTTVAQSFYALTEITEIDIRSCLDLGGSVGDDGSFSSISSETITLTIPASLMTCNGGAPDGDIQYLMANNTVTIVTV